MPRLSPEECERVTGMLQARLSTRNAFNYNKQDLLAFSVTKQKIFFLICRVATVTPRRCGVAASTTININILIVLSICASVVHFVIKAPRLVEMNVTM